VLADAVALAGEMIDPEAEPLLAPLVAPPLTPDQAIGLDLILEGFLLHHGRPRHVAPAAPGREVLAGDYCYAHGLVRIAAAGDLFVVSSLADLIALGACLVAAGERAGLVPLWRATTWAIAARGGPGGPGGAGVEARFRAAQDALRSGAGPGLLEELAATLPPTPGLEEALA
jgi:hypothetical protein